MHVVIKGYKVIAHRITVVYLHVHHDNEPRAFAVVLRSKGSICTYIGQQCRVRSAVGPLHFFLF